MDDDRNVVDMNAVAQFIVSFFDDLERHPGRRLKKSQCSMARMATYLILKDRDDIARKYNDLASKYNRIKDMDYTPMPQWELPKCLTLRNFRDE